MAFDVKRDSEMFDQAADYYDRYRPSYPKELIEDLVIQTQLHKDSRLLEIGAGSGKATELLKDYGFSIHCIEVGENLVRRGKEKFVNHKNISYECIRFEELQGFEDTYDVIFAAQSFHWIPQPIGFELCSQLLKFDGYLAPFWNMYLYDDRMEHQELLELSWRYGGFSDFVSMSQAEDRISKISHDIEKSGLFQTPVIYKYYWEQEYTADEYYGFVQTGNRFLQLPELQQQQAYTEIVQLAKKYGGKIVRPYLAVMYLAQKKR